jgi:hypothetical protein
MLQAIEDTQWLLRRELEPALHAMVQHDLRFDAPPSVPVRALGDLGTQHRLDLEEVPQAVLAPFAAVA